MTTCPMPICRTFSTCGSSGVLVIFTRSTSRHAYAQETRSCQPMRPDTVATVSKRPESTKTMMAQAFCEAGRVLKPRAPLVIVYAHKTTLGWATLVDALRDPLVSPSRKHGRLDTETCGPHPRRWKLLRLASSIFLVARRREGDETGSYERDVRPDLERIVRERVDRLWAQGVTGADLVIACVGAGLRAFTRFAARRVCQRRAGPGRRLPGRGRRRGAGGAAGEDLRRQPGRREQRGCGHPLLRAVALRLPPGRHRRRRGDHLRLPAARRAGRQPRPHRRGQPAGGKAGGQVPPARLQRARRGREAGPAAQRRTRRRWWTCCTASSGWWSTGRDRSRRTWTRPGPTSSGCASSPRRWPGRRWRATAAAEGRPGRWRGAEAAALRKLTTNWRTLIEAHRGPMV